MRVLSCMFRVMFWWCPQVKDVSINYEYRIMGVPTLTLADKGTYVVSATKKYDQMAFK